jgi:tetratricopeptide (TPR) repeat protein
MLYARTLRFAFAAALTLAPTFASAQESQIAALRDAGRDGATTLRLGRAMRRAGRFDEAVRTLQGVRDAALRNDALWEVARVRFDQGVFQTARAACMAFPMPRNNPSASFMRHVCMGRAYLVWNRVALAEREIAAARAINPNDGELQLVIADTRRLASDLPGAEAAYHAAATALPGRDDALLGLAQLYEMFQQLDRAQDHYTQALAAQPDDPAARLAVGRFLLRRRERPTDALPHLRGATENRPHWPEALALYGEALLTTGAHEDALRALQEAAQLSPTQPGVQSSLGRTLVALGRYQEAEVPVRRAIQLVNTDAGAHMALADLLEHTQRETEAMGVWDAAIDRSPGDMTPRLRAAELAHRTHQNALARAYLERVLTDDPNLARALALRGTIAMEDGDRAAARQFLDQALHGNGEFDRAGVQRMIGELDAPVRTRRR